MWEIVGALAIAYCLYIVVNVIFVMVVGFFRR